MPKRITRLAPSPTGALHLGNARTFLVNHLLARREGWRIVLRIEDLDGPRVKKGSAGAILGELEWLGLTWDDRAPDQSQRGEAYGFALAKLVALGRAYPCTCTRSDVARAGSAPHREDAPSAYPGTCRGRWANAEQALAETGRPAAYRLATQGAVIGFDDRFAGPQRFALDEIGGDFVIFKSDGLAAYQLAVVVDDAASGITDVVRGDDLLDSAARQELLRQLLGVPGAAAYWHLPLVVGPDGRRLAKRHGDTRLSAYRARGVRRERLLGLLGTWCGLLAGRREAEMPELLERFDIGLLPRGPVTFSPEDEAFLLAR